MQQKHKRLTRKLLLKDILVYKGSSQALFLSRISATNGDISPLTSFGRDDI